MIWEQVLAFLTVCTLGLLASKLPLDALIDEDSPVTSVVFAEFANQPTTLRVINRIPVKIPVPHLVPVERIQTVEIAQPTPYPVDAPYPVPVNQPVPYAVPHDVPVPVSKPFPWPVPQTVPYPVSAALQGTPEVSTPSDFGSYLDVNKQDTSQAFAAFYRQTLNETPSQNSNAIGTFDVSQLERYLQKTQEIFNSYLPQQQRINYPETSLQQLDETAESLAGLLPISEHTGASLKQYVPTTAGLQNLQGQQYAVIPGQQQSNSVQLPIGTYDQQLITDMSLQLPINTSREQQAEISPANNGEISAGLGEKGADTLPTSGDSLDMVKPLDSIVSQQESPAKLSPQLNAITDQTQILSENSVNIAPGSNTLEQNGTITLPFLGYNLPSFNQNASITLPLIANNFGNTQQVYPLFPLTNFQLPNESFNQKLIQNIPSGLVTNETVESQSGAPFTNAFQTPISFGMKAPVTSTLPSENIVKNLKEQYQTVKGLGEQQNFISSQQIQEQLRLLLEGLQGSQQLIPGNSVPSSTFNGNLLLKPAISTDEFRPSISPNTQQSAANEAEIVPPATENPQVLSTTIVSNAISVNVSASAEVMTMSVADADSVNNQERLELPIPPLTALQDPTTLSVPLTAVTENPSDISPQELEVPSATSITPIQQDASSGEAVTPPTPVVTTESDVVPAPLAALEESAPQPSSVAAASGKRQALVNHLQRKSFDVFPPHYQFVGFPLVQSNIPVPFPYPQQRQQFHVFVTQT